MDMRMVLQGLAPSMENHGQSARQIGPAGSLPKSIVGVIIFTVVNALRIH